MKNDPWFTSCTRQMNLSFIHNSCEKTGHKKKKLQSKTYDHSQYCCSQGDSKAESACRPDHQTCCDSCLLAVLKILLYKYKTHCYNAHTLF